ncbi:DUF2272 domain-containing protein [Falsiroseomonas bella]|uniref:DUF2272 domain-containing protein n=1 Tax=Falsiroseomonas bella TaxID=2184016 RepID=UPI001E46D0AA|nr:DUF2272 domain-containing protein [Falsiroseomonas bella]
MKHGLALLPVLAVAACAAKPPVTYPPSAAERVVRIALAEWQDWGARQRDAFTEPTEDSPESDPRNFPRVLAYWRAVPTDHGAILHNRIRYEAVLTGQLPPGIPLWGDFAWSAAFISWVFVSAGVDAREFPPSATHAFYLDGLIADARSYPDTAAFMPHAPTEYAPRPGDLLCSDRSPRPLLHWTHRAADNGRARPMHCDIVVRTAPGVVEAVGGNVLDTVMLTRFPADSWGRVMPAPPGWPPFLVVMESRLGRLPPWTAAAPPATPGSLPAATSAAAPGAR